MIAKEYIEDFVSLFFPDLCVGCDNPLPKGVKFICPSCQYNLPKTNNHKHEIVPFKEKFEGIVSVKEVLVYCHFQKHGIVQKILHHLKYGNCPEIGEMLGRWYAHELLLSGFKDSFDALVPVPLHPSKQKQRGYNQSEAIAQGVAEVLKIPVLTDKLIRVQKASSLTKMNRVKRILQMKEVFQIQGHQSIEGKRILLVDDVLTTGSTLIACIEQLALAKPQSISVLTLAAA